MTVDVIIPTFNEAENIRELIPAIAAVFKSHNIEGNILVVDDDSPDGTWKVAGALAQQYPVVSIRRENARGLSSAVIEGFRRAHGDIIGFMDADFSHPPAQIIDLVKPIMSGEADLTIGSRYINRGAIKHWPWHRRLSSKVATWLALPFVRIQDPMSGFVFFKKSVIEGVALNPIGFKIGLEIAVKGKYTKLREVPITFQDRKYGLSKLSSRVIFDYLKQLYELKRVQRPFS